MKRSIETLLPSALLMATGHPLEHCHQCECGKEIPCRDSSYMDRAKAIIFVVAALIILFTPWLLMASYVYCKAVLNIDLPLYEQSLYFCGICILSLLGVAPYLASFFKR